MAGWLPWLDEAIRSGKTGPEAVRALLVERPRAWEAEPHLAPDGRTPFEAIEVEPASRWSGRCWVRVSERMR